MKERIKGKAKYSDAHEPGASFPSGSVQIFCRIGSALFLCTTPSFFRVSVFLDLILPTLSRLACLEF